jgi:hypothetical protein
MLDGKQLRTRFNQYNKQYFKGRIPAYSIRVVGHITALGEGGRCKRDRNLIEIAHQPDDEAISTLLHEMVHAATTDTHAMAWKRMMIRLREAGAPFANADLDVAIGDWDGLHVARNHFRGVVQDTLMDAPDITFSDAVRHFIRCEGGAPTISAFVEKCPWAKAMFARAKKENDANRKRLTDLRALLGSPSVVGSPER